MAENATVFRATQLGVESTKGVTVPTNRRLLATGFKFSPQIPVEAFTPMGSKAPTTAVRRKEWTEGDIEGVFAYDDTLYLASGALEAATITTPTGATNTRRWTFLPANFDVDDYPSFTIETGPATGTFGERASYGLINGFEISITAEETSVSGAVLARGIVDGITPTASPTDITAFPVSTNTVDIFVGSSLANEVQTVTLGGPSAGNFKLTFTSPFDGATEQTANIAFNASSAAVLSALQALALIQPDDVTVSGSAGGPYTITFTGRFAGINVATLVGDFSGLTGGTSAIATTTQGGLVKLSRCLEWGWGLSDRFTGIMTLCASDPSFSSEVEKAPSFDARIVIEHDSTSVAYMSNLRNVDTLYCKMVTNGPNIELDFFRRVDITFPFKFSEPSRDDNNDVWASEYTLIPVYDSTLGGYVKIQVDTARATL